MNRRKSATSSSNSSLHSIFSSTTEDTSSLFSKNNERAKSGKKEKKKNGGVEKKSDPETHSRKFEFTPSPEPIKRSGQSAKQTGEAIQLKPASTSEQKRNKESESSRSDAKMNSIEAVEMHKLSVLKELVKANSIELKRTDNKGKTLMSIACENGYDDIVKYLAENDDTLINKETHLGIFFLNILTTLVSKLELGCIKKLKNNNEKFWQ